MEIELGLSPITFAANLGGGGVYTLSTQDADQALNATVNGSLQMGSGGVGITANGNGIYESHTIELEGLKGYFGLGGGAFVNANIGAATTFQIELMPVGFVGIGRVHGIQTIKEIELTMRHLGIEPTVENIKAVAEIIYRNRSLVNAFAEDTSIVLLDYWKSVAEAYGIPERISEVLLIGNSPRYAFERARYANLLYGMKAQLGLQPTITLRNSAPIFSLDANIAALAQYADFMMEGLLYYLAQAELLLDLQLIGGTFGVDFGIELGGTARYFPDDPRWWVDADAAIGFNTAQTPMFAVNLSGEMNYLVNPNFTLSGGVAFSDIFTDIDIFAGGNIRLW